MRKIVLSFIFLLACDARSDEWTRADTAWEASAVALIAIDWMQTTSFRQENYYETNPILGTEPSQRRVNLLIGGAMLGHVVVARLLPGGWPRRAFQALTITMELGAVTNNAMNGVGLAFPF